MPLIDPSLHVTDTSVSCPVLRKQQNVYHLDKLRAQYPKVVTCEGSNKEKVVTQIPEDGSGSEVVNKTNASPGLKLKLSKSKYSPALNRKDVRKKVQSALLFFLPRFNWTYPFEMNVAQLEAALCANQAKPLFYWLRQRLLGQPVMNYNVSAGKANRWVVNQDGFARTWQEVFNEPFDYAKARADQIRPEFEPYIKGEIALPLMSYGEGQRVYGPHLELETCVKKVLLAGCKDFDIQAACPTLMTQYVGGQNWERRFPLWRRYLGNRTFWREKLASDYNLTAQQAKDVFQQLFSLAKFNGSSAGIGKTVGSRTCKRMMEDKVLVGLYEEAQELWKETGWEQDGTGRFRAYEQIEQKIMSTVYRFFDDNKVRYWPFHDGFTVLDNVDINVQALQDFVKEETGYSVIFDMEIL